MSELLFPQAFLDGLSDLELVALQHELLQYQEDRPYLIQVLDELSKRSKRATVTLGPPGPPVEPS